MSADRLQAFDTCTTSTVDLRRNAQISGAFKYDTKMSFTDAVKVQQWLFRQDVKTPAELLSHNGMAKAAQLMCRWPRPSELAHMVSSMKGPRQPFYYRMTIQIALMNPRATDRTTTKVISNFVGPMGMNFNRISEERDLMYMWLHTNRLVMYAVDMDYLTQALADVRNLADMNGIAILGHPERSVHKLGLDSNAPAWEARSVKKRGLNINAPPWHPRTQVK